MTDAPLRHRPIVGRLFGNGRYALASMPVVVKGLHAVRFMVIEPSTGCVLSIAQDKAEALEAARTLLEASEQLAQHEARRDNTAALQGELWPLESTTPIRVAGKRRPVSRRRRDIFAKCGGACHYCAKPLTLDGRWHVEHMLPSALGGLDEIKNLVASCPECNLAKRDRTAIEYMVESGSTSFEET